MTDDLTSLKDDMTAFIEGHGMRRFRGYVDEEIHSINWGEENEKNPEGWKDFVELAKAAGAPFLTMNAVVLDKEDVDYLIERLRNAVNAGEEDMEEARWLRAYTGKTGFIQIGYPFQGIMFLHEVSTDWYDRYQRLMDIADEFGGITIDESDQDDER